MVGFVLNHRMAKWPHVQYSQAPSPHWLNMIKYASIERLGANGCHLLNDPNATSTAIPFWMKLLNESTKTSEMISYLQVIVPNIPKSNTTYIPLQSLEIASTVPMNPNIFTTSSSLHIIFVYVPPEFQHLPNDSPTCPPANPETCWSISRCRSYRGWVSKRVIKGSLNDTNPNNALL